MLLNFEHIKQKHTNSHLIIILLKILQEINLQDRIMRMTIDETSNNEILSKTMKRTLQQEITSSSVFENDSMSFIINSHTLLLCLTHVS